MPSLFPENEKQLLQQASEGDEEAFAQIFNAYSHKLYAFIYRLAGSKELAEDVVQDVFLKLWQQRGMLNIVDNFNAFLYRMSYNHAINLLKRLSKETLILMEARQHNSNEPLPPDEQMIFNRVQQYIAKIVNDLPPQQKTVYQLSREQNLTQEGIARRMDISISTVQNHMTQALRKIKESLAKRWSD